MPCYLVTCGGWGRDVYSFPDRSTLLHHPLYQAGDAVVSSLEDLVQEFYYDDVPKMLRIYGMTKLAKEAEDTLPRLEFPPERERYAIHLHKKIMEHFAQQALPPPESAEEILEAIRRHRAISVKLFNYEKRPSIMSEATTEATPRPPRTGKLNPASQIHFGSSKDGVKFDTAENSPYRAGSNRQARWSKLREGMTVAEVCALDGYAAATLEREIGEGKIVLA